MSGNPASRTFSRIDSGWHFPFPSRVGRLSVSEEEERERDKESVGSSRRKKEEEGSMREKERYSKMFLPFASKGALRSWLSHPLD